MPQIVQPNVEGSSPVGGGASVGAVILDQPAFDPLQVQMKVDKDIADYRAQKDAEVAAKKANVAKMVADLDFDAKGILDSDAPYFTQGKNELIDAQAELYKYNDTNSPEYQMAFNRAKRVRDKYATEVQASVAGKEILKEYISKFDPSKNDEKQFNEIVANARAKSNPVDRIKYLSENPLKEKAPDLAKEYEKVKALFPESITEETYKGDDGKDYTKKITEYTQQQINDYAKIMADSNSDLSKAANNAFDKLQETNPSRYKEIIILADKEGVPANEMFNREWFKKLNSTNIELQGGSYNPYTLEDAKNWGSSQAEEKTINFIGEQWANLVNGVPDVYDVKNTRDIPLSGGNLQQNKYYSTMFQGNKIGNFSVIETVDDATKAVNVPNTILSFKFVDGKPYIKTDETAYNKKIKKNSVNGRPIDAEGYVEASNGDIERMISSNSTNPAKAIEAWRAYLIRNKVYNKNVEQPNKVVQTDERITDQGTVSNVKAPKQVKTVDASGNLVDANGNVIESVQIQLNGKVGTIPASSWESFKKKYPTAIRK